MCDVISDDICSLRCRKLKTFAMRFIGNYHISLPFPSRRSYALCTARVNSVHSNSLTISVIWPQVMGSKIFPKQISETKKNLLFCSPNFNQNILPQKIHIKLTMETNKIPLRTIHQCIRMKLSLPSEFQFLVRFVCLINKTETHLTMAVDNGLRRCRRSSTIFIFYFNIK